MRSSLVFGVKEFDSQKGIKADSKMAVSLSRRNVWVKLFICFFVVSCAEAKKDCMIDDEKGWFDVDNVYTCEENSRCCKEYGNPSCCAEKNKWLIVKDQLVLWGGLFGFLSFLGLVVYCRRKDFYVLEGSSPCSRVFGKKREEEEEPIQA